MCRSPRKPVARQFFWSNSESIRPKQSGESQRRLSAALLPWGVPIPWSTPSRTSLFDCWARNSPCVTYVTARKPSMRVSVGSRASPLAHQIFRYCGTGRGYDIAGLAGEEARALTRHVVVAPVHVEPTAALSKAVVCPGVRQRAPDQPAGQRGPLRTGRIEL